MTEVAAETTPQWVHVAILGGDTQQLDFTAGMTVGQALEAAGLTRQRGTMVQVNGVPADDDQELEPNSAVQITTQVKNG
ncbi:MAG TPA: hypothetical protein VMT23_00550 [Candidatus Binatia bacterium]|nr:hypothetical protein [Candidatus Binatia bacterium]